MFHNVWTTAIVGLLSAAALVLLWCVRGRFRLFPEGWLGRVDNRVADWCDDVADFVWAWTGASRKRQRELTVSVVTLLCLADLIGRHSWLGVELISIFFFGSFLHRNRASSVFEFLEFLLRISCLAFFVVLSSVSILSLIFEFRKWPVIVIDVIRFALFVFYLYLLFERPRPRDRRRRHSISELLRLFGLDWIPGSPKVEAYSNGEP